MTQLYKGSTGADVLALQTKLRDAGFYKGALDSSFGPQTDAALRAFQTAAGIKVDGYYGPQSASALLTYKPTTTTTAPNTTTLPNTAITVPTTYNPAGMTGANATAAQGAYKEQSSELTRDISNVMNRRGIYGSTIMGENIKDSVNALKTSMDNAWRSAYARGYATNDEAAILGLTPGARLRPEDKPKTSLEDAPSGAVTKDKDGNYYDKNGDVLLNDYKKFVLAQAKSKFSSYGYGSTDNVFQTLQDMNTAGELTDVELAYMIKYLGYVTDYNDPMNPKMISSISAYEAWVMAQEQKKKDALIQQQKDAEAEYLRNNPYETQVIRQESRWGY